MVRYPERLLTDDETIVRAFRPHWKVLIPPVALAVVALAVGVVLVQLASLALWLGIAVGTGVGVLLAASGVIRWLFTHYVLTSERIVVRTGMLARQGTEIPLENINNVLFSQTILERLLGYGDVLVESAGSLGQSRLRDIPDPEAFQSQIYRAREGRTLHLEGGGAASRDTVAQLEALADLHDRGALTAEEFAEQKRRLLEGGPPGSPR